MKTKRSLIQAWLLGMGLLAVSIAARAQFICSTNDGSITIVVYTGSGGAVTIPSTVNGFPVTSIGEDAFSDALYGGYVTSVSVPNSVTNIGNYAFEDCVSLTTVTVGTGLNYIGQFAFSDCPNLVAIYFYGNPPSEGIGAFELDDNVTFYYLGTPPPGNPPPLQNVTNLHNFAKAYLNSNGYNTNIDGIGPYAGVVISSNSLYGATTGGGVNGNGTLFAVNTDGTGFTNLHIFTAYQTNYANVDGWDPYGSLILSGSTLYGTAGGGGSYDGGTIFAINVNGTGFTNLHNFNGTNGSGPQGGLILSGSTLYGTTMYGGSNGNGSIFAVNTNGTGFTNLYTFTAYQYNNPSDHPTNVDGANPGAALILSGNTLYGTADGGGSNNGGTVFKVNIDGTDFTNLHNFTGGSDGELPHAGVILSGNTLYGTTLLGGNGYGAVFAVNTDGTGFTNLHSFTATSGSGYTNSDGAFPEAPLILLGNTLYGAARGGGSAGYGTVFALNVDGTTFANLNSFAALTNSTNSTGAIPYAGLILSGGTLYGTASSSGSSGSGTVFSLTLGVVSVPPPQLTITRSGNNVILTWPTHVTGFTLESTTSPVLTNWSAVSPGPIVVNGQNTVTNAVSGTQRFYRLYQ